jgi:uncharacterized protein YhaN
MKRCFSSICLALWLGAGADASAQSTAKPKLATRDDYRACVAEDDRLLPIRQSLQARKVQHDAELKRFQDDSQAHVAGQPKIDTGDQAAVDAFNARLDALNARVAELNAHSARMNDEQAAFNAQVAAHNKRCAGMVVSFADRDAVMKERAAAQRGAKP